MPMRLIRRPRSPRVLHGIIRDEVRGAYNALADDIIATLKNDISSWSDQPEFTKNVDVGEQRWFIVVNYDKTTRIGEIYGWVDKGTAEKAGGKPYDIYPVEADALYFTVPNLPKTVATDFGIPGIVLEHFSADISEVYTDHVEHTGIEPRRFTASVQEYYTARTRIGGFRSVTEAAIKRGARKIGI